MVFASSASDSRELLQAAYSRAIIMDRFAWVKEVNHAMLPCRDVATHCRRIRWLGIGGAGCVIGAAVSADVRIREEADEDGR
jgi:hypothetical protein